MKNLNSAKIETISGRTCVLFFDSFGYKYKKTAPVAVCVAETEFDFGKISYPVCGRGVWEGVFNPPMDDEECQLVELAFHIVKKIRRKVENHIRKLGVGPWFEKLAEDCSVNFVKIR